MSVFSQYSTNLFLSSTNPYEFLTPICKKLNHIIKQNVRLTLFPQCECYVIKQLCLYLIRREHVYLFSRI